KETSKAAPTTKSASLQRPHDPLELSLPDAALAPAGRSAAFARPPNITRSGENDEFGRAVIRALRRTMPGSDKLGQVTVRLFLSETGNLLEARLVRSGGDPIMDQNVLFAAKQASFPIPPNGATVADRTFLRTYVYPLGCLLELDVGHLDQLGVTLGILHHMSADLRGRLRGYDHVDGAHLGDDVFGLGKLDQRGVELGQDVLGGAGGRYHEVPDGNVGIRIAKFGECR